MLRQKVVETRQDRMALARDAGLGRVSFISILTGTLVAYGAFAVVAALAGAVLNAVGVDITGLSANDWRQLGIGGGIVVGLVLFLAYFFGGYTAGRMARRSGAANGILVFVLGIVIAGVVGTLASTQAGTDQVIANLRSLGVPTSGSEYAALASFAGLGVLLAMLLGSALGGTAGERWHGKLMARATASEPGPRPAPTTGGDGDEIDLRDRRAHTSDTTAIPADETTGGEGKDKDLVTTSAGHPTRRAADRRRR